MSSELTSHMDDLLTISPKLELTSAKIWFILNYQAYLVLL